MFVRLINATNETKSSHSANLQIVKKFVIIEGHPAQQKEHLRSWQTVFRESTPKEVATNIPPMKIQQQQQMSDPSSPRTIAPGTVTPQICLAKYPRVSQ